MIAKPPPEGADLLMAVLEVSTAEEFGRFLAENPLILSKEVLGELRRMSSDPVAGPAFAALDELLHTAALGDPVAAWKSYESRRQEVEGSGNGFDAKLKEAEAALAVNEVERVIEIVTEVLPAIHGSGLVIMESLFYEMRGKALVQRREGDRATNLEAAISDFRKAAIRAPVDNHQAMVLMHAGIAFRERIHGDRTRNLEQAIELLREALTLLDESASPELWAILRTNLASTLLAFEGPARVERLREAAELCRVALAYRTPERDAVDWAYTQINYAFVLQDLAALGDGDVSEAKSAFGEVIAEADRFPQKWLVGVAHCALGRIELIASERSPEEQMAAVESEAEERRQHEEEVAQLELARQQLETGLKLTLDDPLVIRRGRALDDLAAVLTRLDRPQEAIPVGREALEIMRPSTAPRECLSIGGRLGDQLATEGEWEEAAAAFAEALDAAEFSFYGRLETAAREDEARRAGELARWAAMVFARIGRLEEAALALESGRTRELRRRLGIGEAEEERLAQMPRELREAFETASAALSGSPLDDSAADAGLALQEVLEEIRRLPGMADFATGPHWNDLSAAVDAKWPLVYVNPTPWGTLFLRIAARDGGTEADALILDEPNSLEVYYRLALGTALDPAAPPGLRPSSYLAAVADEGTAVLKAGLEQVLPWLGERLCEPLARWLHEGGDTRVTLVPCGPISTAPLGAAPWEEGGDERCLLDIAAVRYAPSALIAARARARVANAAGEPKLLALADPDGSLDGAEPEVQEIAKHFGGREMIARGTQADSAYLRAEIGTATHLHFACHAQAGIFDTTATGIILADGFLSAHELPALEATSLRLAVISACQSAVTQIARLPNEVFSTSTALLAAGGGCVIASLWPVDDGATAMLMTRLYEEMFAGGLEPPEALRSAQLWLRDLSDHEKEDFLDAHPLIGAEIRRREAGERRRRARASGAPGQPYSHPDYWAPFIAVGA